MLKRIENVIARFMSLPGFQVILAIVILGLASISPALAQEKIDPENRPIAEIRIEGLEQVPEQFVRNQIRHKEGGAFNSKTVQQDIVRINHLGRFSSVRAEITAREDGSLVLTYVIAEWPLLVDVQIVGNKAIADQRLKELILLTAGDPVDPFLIDRGLRLVEEAYQQKGYFVASIAVDQEVLDEQSVLLVRVREGPLVRIKQFKFDGNQSIRRKILQREIRSETYFPIIREGTLSREQLDLDAAAMREVYRDQGYLDAQVARRIDLSPDQASAVVTFIFSEGERYLVDQVRVEGNELFPDEQVLKHLELGRGDIFSARSQQRSAQRVELLYGRMGYIEAEVVVDRLFHDDSPKVDLVVRINENNPHVVGQVEIRGNELTKTRVALHDVRGMEPGRRFDGAGIDETRRRLNNGRLFSDATVTVLGDDRDLIRDVLIEVQEQNTGSVSFGLGVSSDAGLLGSIELTQRNFDITDIPESTGEFFSGRAFRGAGQNFRLALQPGNEVSQYLISISDPHLFDTDYSAGGTVFFRTRDFDEYDEQRYGGNFFVGKQFGDVWSGRINFRAEQIELSDIEEGSPQDFFDVEGDNLLTTVGLSLTRSTVNSSLLPTRGSQFRLSLERAGLIGGDFDYTKLSTNYQKFWLVDRDFLDRPFVVSLRLEGGYIIEEDEAPVFERFYAGGQRSFRGFDFRGIGPKGIDMNGNITEDAVGGQWLLLFGLEYEFPLVGDTLRGVIFTDQGTLLDEPGFEEWRVSVGTGLRLRVPMISPVPFAFDFAIPLAKEDTDDTRIFTFDIDLPLR